MFSATNLYDPFLKQFFNNLFTLLPIITHGLFDREFPQHVLSKCAFLYKWGTSLYGTSVLLYWLMVATWMGAWALYVPYLAIGPGSYDIYGHSGMSVQSLGCLVLVCTVTGANVLIYLFNNTTFWFSHAGCWAGLGLLVVTWLIFEVAVSSPRSGTFSLLFSSVRSWAALALFLGIALFPVIVLHTVTVLFKPSNARIAQERLAMGVHDLVVAQPHAEVDVSPQPRRLSGYAFAEESDVDRIGIYVGEAISTAGPGRRGVSETLYGKALVHDRTVVEL
jgi:hypothetical protein